MAIKGALMEVNCITKVQQRLMKLSQARLTCDTLRQTIKEREAQREQRNQSIANIVERLTPLRNLLISTTERCEVELPKAKELADRGIGFCYGRG